MNDFLPVKRNYRATPLRLAARIISIIILAFLWSARGGAQEQQTPSDLDLSNTEITDKLSLFYQQTSNGSNDYAWYYKIGDNGSETQFSGKLTGTKTDCPTITIKSTKEATATDYTDCATLQLDGVSLTAANTANLIEIAEGTKPLCIEVTGSSASNLKATGSSASNLKATGEGYVIKNNNGGILLLDGGTAGLNIVAEGSGSNGIYLNTTNSSVRTTLKGKITFTTEAYAVSLNNGSALSAAADAKVTIASENEKAIYYGNTPGRVKSPFLQWQFATDQTNDLTNQTLEVKDASGNSLSPAIQFTTDGKKKGFAVNVAKDTDYTLWLGNEQLMDNKGAFVFKATDNKIFSFSGMRTFPTDWSEYAQVADVGSNGTDVAVSSDKTTYTVKTARGLAWIAWVTNNGKKKNDNTGETYTDYYPVSAGFENCTVTLEGNISLAKPTEGVASGFKEEWIPIGTDQNENKSFEGTFEGNGKTVSGLSITKANYAGLFGSLAGATVKDLRVEGQIAITSVEQGNIHIGGIAGFVGSRVQLINCTNAVEITGNLTTTTDNAFVGGIAGKINGAGPFISNCWNVADVSFTTVGGVEVGGIAGRLKGTITNCYSTGAIKGSGTSNSAFISCGGIVGAFDNNQGNKTVSNCYATGVVSATSVAATGTASTPSTSGNNASAGGIVGYMVSYNSSYTSTIKNCLALNVPQSQTASIPADVSAGVSATAAAGTTASAGRIVGKKNDANCTLSDNYASTLITLLAETTAEDNIPASVNSTTLAVPTENIGADQINGADLYLDEAAAAIASWAGDNDNTKAFTAIGTAAGGKLPKLKKATAGADGLPTTFGEVFADQPDLVSANYLKGVEALTLSENDASTITISYADGKWSYKKGEGSAVGFNGTIKCPENSSSTDKLVINSVTGNPILTFDNVKLKPTNNTGLTIQADCELTLKGSLNIDVAAPDNGGTYYCIENSGKLTVADPSTTGTKINLHSYGTAINNASNGMLNNAWMEWRFATAMESGTIILTPTDNSQRTQASHTGTTFATVVTPGMTYKYWILGGNGNLEHSKCQQGKAADGTSVIYYPAPAESGVAVFTDVKEAVSVTVTQPTGGGGSISVFCNDNLLAANDYVPDGATLACRYNALPGYELDTYTATPGTDPSTPSDVSTSATYQVPEGATSIAITASFKVKSSTADVKEEEVKASEPTSAVTVPTVVIPTNDRPEITEGSTIKLITGDLEEARQDEVKEALKDVDHNKLIYAEIALVEVKDDGTKIPIQPTANHPVTVIYPYPSGTTSLDIFTIVHLKTDGTTEIYSVKKGNLENTTAGLKFSVSSFSPFGIAWTKNSTTDPDDPGTTPDPDPAPTVYYTVVIPALEGATTDPVAGAYEVEAWDSFRFYLTLDPDYDQSTPVVTTDRGETIEPRNSDGAYIIRYVRTPVEISIAGIQKNADVANATILSGTRVWTEPSAVCLETDRTEEVHIVSLTGTTVAAFTAQPGTTRQALAPGVYVVKMGRAVYKVIVR